MATQTSLQRDELKTTGEGFQRGATQTYRVYDDANADIVNGEVALSLLDINRGDNHPTYTDLRAATFTVAQVVGAGSGRMYDITWEYLPAPLVPTDFGRDDLVPGAGQVARISQSTKTIWVDCWRVDWQVTQTNSNLAYQPAPNGASNPTLPTLATVDDVRGYPIDSKGKAVSCAVVQSVVDIRQTLQQRIPFTTLTSKVGRRNESVEFGAPIGSLLFLGADSVERDTGAFDYVWHFAWDANNHARQQVWRDTDGKPREASPTGGSVEVAYSGGNFGWPVYWVQPFPLLASFSGLGINLP